MEQNDNFEIKNVDEIDMLEILKPELAKVLGRCEKGYVDSNSIKLQMRNPWVKEELDGRTYDVKNLYITFTTNYESYYKFCYVVKLTPFNCYFCDEATHRKNLCQPSKYPVQRDKNLTQFYRRKMQELYGENWTNAFNAYIERVKKYKKEILDEAYQESIREIERDIAEEQTF